MKVSMKTICRSEGNTYLEVEILKDSADAILRFAAKSEKGTALPIESFVLSVNENKETVAFATPTLSTKKIVLHAEERGPEGSILNSKNLSVNRNLIKLASKASYFLPFIDPYRIRGIEKRTGSKYIRIKPSYCSMFMRNQWFYLLKVSLRIDANESAFELNVLDSSGRPIKEYATEVECHTKTNGDASESIADATFRLPADKAPYCITANGVLSRSEGFLGLDKKYLGSLLNSVDNPYYEIASPQHYGLLRKKIENEESAAPHYDHVDLDHPTFSIVVPLYKTAPALLQEMVSSVQRQAYANWELILINASPEDATLAQKLIQLDDPRIKVLSLEKNEGISGNTNRGIKASRGDYIAFLDHDDTLSPIALAEYAKALCNDSDIVVLYSDEDFISEQGEYCNPQFKSDFNIDLLRCHNYITHFLAVQADYAKQLLLRPEFDGAQDYDLVLRLSETGEKFHHVPKVLYHWRMTENSTASNSANKNYAIENGRLALQDHLNHLGISGTVTHTNAACYYHANYDVIGTPLVSIIIPNKDSASILAQCVDSIFEKTFYSNFEIVIVENNSIEDLTFNLYDELEKKYERVRVLKWDEEFNYSKINNFAAKSSRGEYIVFLNNDTEVITPHWIDSMLSICQRNDVGAVGAKLLYPDNTIQHAGVAMKSCITPLEMNGPFHVFQHIDADTISYARRAELTQDVLAVTAACMMTKRSLFLEVGGFDSDFRVAFNDIDYCFKLRDMGYLVVYDPYAQLYHYESLTRGEDTKESGLANYSRFFSEQGLLRYKWPTYFIEDDPYFGKYARLIVEFELRD